MLFKKTLNVIKKNRKNNKISILSSPHLKTKKMEVKAKKAVKKL
jgi:hypothetical protein